jgi:hypothetical protein
MYRHPSYLFLFRFAGLLFGWVVIPWQAQGAERYELQEDPAASHACQVATELEVTGKLFPAPGPEKALKLKVEGKFRYAERRLKSAARDAASLRSVRQYESAQAQIQAGDELSDLRLRDSQKLIVAEGSLNGIDLFSPAGPLTYSELELLHSPADSLAILAWLPESPVESDDTWKVPFWSLPLVTGIEAVEKGSVTCRLESVKETLARVRFEGEVTGASVGAPSVVEIQGHLDFDLKRKIVVRVEALQKEKRAIGAISPGLDVSARVVVTRARHESESKLSTQELTGIPLEANPANRLLLFEAPGWSVRLYHGREWHVFQKSSDSALLRLLDQGGFIAQCNVKKLPNTEPGKHVADKKFQQDIQESLGKNFQEFLHSERINAKDGLYIYRVVVGGTIQRANEKKEPEINPMQWIYYLVAHPDGRQLSFVFSVDARQIKEFGTRDLAIVTGAEFLRPRAVPASAERTKPR